MTAPAGIQRLRESAHDDGRWPPRTLDRLAIVHANVITMERAQPLADHTVLMERGVITAVAPSAALDVTHAQIVDGSNLYLMPGLADMHTHVTDAGVCALYLANGVTRLRNMDGRPWHLALARRLESGELCGPRLTSVSPLIDGLGERGLTARPQSLVVTDGAQAGPLARQLVARGYSEIKAYQWLTLDALRALGNAAARAGVRMAGHCPDGVTFEESIAAGMTCFEHLTGIATGHLHDGRQFPALRDAAARRGTRESIELIAHHIDFDAIRRLAHTMAAKDIWNCPTLVVWQKQIQHPQTAASDPDLRYEHPSTVHEWQRMLSARYAAPPCPADEWLALGRARDEALARVVSILHQEGAPLLLGTDAPNAFVIHGCAIHQELENLVRAGLSAYEALRCGTAQAARFFGEGETSGTIAPGKAAELILLRANPLENVAALRSGLEAVFVNGYYLNRADLDRLLADYVASLAAPAPTQLPDADMAARVRDALPAQRGLLQEWSGDVHVGRASYFHGRMPDGGWRVEEHSARSGPRGPQRCSAHLWLASDWTVRRAEIELETDVGRESSEISWFDGGYRARITQADGYSCDCVLASGPLLPSERLAFSVLPGWLATRSTAVTTSSLSIEHEAMHVAELAAEPAPADATQAHAADEVNWRVSVARRGELATQTYRISNDGGLLKLSDVLFGAPRQLVAVT
ncbi:MAG: amidohydrolase family protein [Steroidobacteraceae bacterium]